MRNDRIVAVIMLFFGVFVFTEGLGIPRAELQRGPGPGAFPMFLGVLVLVLGALLFLSTLHKKRARVPSAPLEAGSDALPAQEPLLIRLRRVGWAVALLAVYFVLLGILGFVAATVVFGVIYLCFTFRQRLLPSLFTAVVLALAGFILFEVALKVPLPGFLESIR